MRIKIYHLITLLALMAIIHVIAIANHMYEGTNIWIDKPLHVMGGMLFALLGLWLFQGKMENAGRFIRNYATISFSLVGSFIWELYELSFWTWLRGYSLWFKLYSPTVQDALLDMLYGVVGGVCVAIAAHARNRAPRQ